MGKIGIITHFLAKLCSQATKEKWHSGRSTCRCAWSPWRFRQWSYWKGSQENQHAHDSINDCLASSTWRWCQSRRVIKTDSPSKSSSSHDKFVGSLLICITFILISRIFSIYLVKEIMLFSLHQVQPQALIRLFAFGGLGQDVRKEGGSSVSVWPWFSPCWLHRLGFILVVSTFFRRCISFFF